MDLCAELLGQGADDVAESFEQHIPKGYIYFAMGFSVFVEFINLRARAAREPVQLRHTSRDPHTLPAH